MAPSSSRCAASSGRAITLADSAAEAVFDGGYPQRRNAIVRANDFLVLHAAANQAGGREPFLQCQNGGIHGRGFTDHCLVHPGAALAG